MGKRKIITSKAQPLEGEANLFAPPPPVPKVPHEQRAFLVSLQWRPRPDKMGMLRGQYPRLDLEEELAKMLAWHHKHNMRRVQWERTFSDWCARASTDWSDRQVQRARDKFTGFKRPSVPPLNRPYNPADLRDDLL